MRSLFRSLVLEGRITTSEAKARELRPVMEKAITLGKKGNLVSRRLLASRAGSDEVAKKIATDIAPKHAARQGGYTRILKLGRRRSDGAKMAIIEFVK